MIRELNSFEIEQVSGAGIIANVAGSIGTAIGNLIDSAAAAFGLKSTVSSFTTSLAQGIGSLFELNLFGAAEQIISGLTGIVQYGISIISEIIPNFTGS